MDGSEFSEFMKFCHSEEKKKIITQHKRFPFRCIFCFDSVENEKLLTGMEMTRLGENRTIGFVHLPLSQFIIFRF